MIVPVPYSELYAECLSVHADRVTSSFFLLLFCVFFSYHVNNKQPATCEELQRAPVFAFIQLTACNMFTKSPVIDSPCGVFVIFVAVHASCLCSSSCSAVDRFMLQTLKNKTEKKFPIRSVT